MSERITIDIEARFTDNASSGMNSAAQSASNLEKSAERAKKAVGGLASKKVTIDIGANDTAEKKIDSVQSKADRLAGKKTSMQIDAKDQASGKVSRVKSKLAAFAGRTYNAFLGVKDTASTKLASIGSKAAAFAGRSYNAYVAVRDSGAMRTISNIKSGLAGLEGKAWNISVGIVDKVTSPVRKVLGGLNSALGLAGAGLGAYGLVVKPIQLEVEQQDLVSTFEVFLGSKEAAQNRIEELTTFAGSTPFTRDDIFKASRQLQMFTGNALSTGKGLTMIGDIAAGTKQPITDVALWVGRMYDSMKAGRPIGEMTARLQEMGAINGEARNKLDELAKSGKNISQIWPEVEKQFSRFDGLMEKQSGNLGNLLLGVKSFVTNNVLKKIGTGLGEGISPLLKDFRQWRKENGSFINQMGDSIQAFSKKISLGAMNRLQSFVSSANKVFSGAEFKNAPSVWGKISVAWNQLVAQPFSDWWDVEGKDWLSGKASGLGSFLGGGLSNGILTILGVDAGGIAGEGADIGRSFWKGFTSAFDGDAVKSAVKNTIKNLFGSAADLLPGGKSPSLASFLSAAVLFKGGSKLFGGVGKLTGGLGGLLGVGGKTAAGGVKTWADVIGTAKVTSDEAALLTGADFRVLQGSGMIGNLAKFGKFAGSTALTGTGLALAGGAGAVGGALGIAGLINAGGDIYTGVKADYQSDKKRYLTRGVTKGGTVLGGAGIGAAIGSIIPGIGTVLGGLAGAGIGTIISFVKGNDIADSISGISKSGEELRQENLDKHFGKIALSLKEVKLMASELEDTALLGSLSKSASARAEMASYAQTYEKYADSLATTQTKLKWKFNQGHIISDEEKSGYKASALGMGQSSVEYIGQLRQSASLSYNALFGESGGMGLKEATDQFLINYENEMQGYKEQLNVAVDIALETGDFSGVDDLEDRIQGQMKLINDALNQGKLDLINFKYEGKLDYNSVNSYFGELDNYLAEAKGGLQDEMEFELGIAHLKFAKGELDKNGLQAEVEAIKNQYTLKSIEIELPIQIQKVSKIKEAYGSEINQAFAGLEQNFNTNKDKIKRDLGKQDFSSIYSTLFPKISPESKNTLSEFFQGFDLKGLEDSRQKLQELGQSTDEIDGLIQTVTNLGALSGDEYSLSKVLGNLFGEGTESSGWQKSLDEANKTFGKLGEESKGAFMQGWLSGVNEGGNGTENTLQTESLLEPVITDLNSDKYTEKINESGKGFAEKLWNAIRDAFGITTAYAAEDGGAGTGAGDALVGPIVSNMEQSIERADFSGVADRLNNKISEAFINIGQGGETTGIDKGSFLGNALMTNLTNSISQIEVPEGLGAAIKSKIIAAISSGGAEGGGDTSGLASALQSQLSASFSTMTIDANITLNPTFTFTNAGEEGLTIPPITATAEAAIALNAAYNINNPWEPPAFAVSTTATVGITATYNLLNPTWTPPTFNVSTTANVSITASYSLTNPPSASMFNFGGVIKPRHSATGRITSGRMLSWVGEEGPEAIIPLVPSRRQRGLDLWFQAGKALGVLENAEGGIVGGTNASIPTPKIFTPAEPSSVITSGISSGVTKIEVGGITIQVTGGNSDITEEISKHQNEIVEIVSNALKNAAEKYNAAVPTKGGAF